MKKEAEFHISDGQYLTMKTTYTVQMKDKLRLLIGEGKSRDLDITITADFEKIPKEYHLLFMKMMMVRYGGIVNIHDNTNPFEDPKTPKKPWYKFWKSN
jgi:hypothetical protein